jgi:hypothetical protein
VTPCTTPRCENPGRWQVTETGARVCAEHLPMGKPAFLAEPAPPPASPYPQPAVSQDAVAMMRQANAAFGAMHAPPPAEPPAEATQRRPSVIPADWPRDMHGMLVGPRMPKWAGLDINQRRRALAEWIGRIPDPPGGWRGRDAIAFDAIYSMITFFAPLTSDDWMEWRPIQEAATALVRMVEAIEREQWARLADEAEVNL